MHPNKACPVVVRGSGPALAIMAFRHPLSGCQLVKGTIERGERAEEAAVRELLEEAGIHGRVLRDLGLWQSGHNDQLWSFHLCQAATVLPDTWSHHCADAGGHTFEFFWQPLYVPPADGWHPVHIAAMDYVRRSLSFSLSRSPV